MPPHVRAIALLAVAGFVVASCGSSSKTSSSTSPSATASPEATTSPTGGAATTPGQSSQAGGPPAVANASNLSAKPQIAAGTPPKPSQLVVKDLVVGTGAKAAASATVRVQYVGVNYDNGQEFDSSWSRGQPADFPLANVIPGFSQGIVGMKVGGRRELVIPPVLGYGAQGSPPQVGPNETLVFVIDLLAVR